MTSTQQRCQNGPSKGRIPCLANINVLAGVEAACEVCAPNMPKMRDMMGWVPFKGRFYHVK